MLRCGMIGLGKQAQDDHLPALLESPYFNLVGVYDIDRDLVDSTSRGTGASGYYLLDDMIAAGLDVAVISVPHNAYLPIIEKLADSNIHIIKEKPLATTMEEALKIHKYASGRVFVGVIAQRRFNPIFQAFDGMRKNIGKIYSIEGKYVMNIDRLDRGWRSSKALSGGGALIDMGYHYVDLLVWYFGMPTSVSARLSRGNREKQEYDVEAIAPIDR